ncbi:hypothetical protein NLM31_07635 [Bradyrhizobium sp. CCGUVB4N]|uniref:hypothetical protein n=1 Tax=Bradyrhizobium sp. CCGUVB4N TaxID=2949631 RepID=UPI0020B39853|nr:hypothetical protein [Bradyrhizobium sp. CCGUVB4N]MCP3380264.1 hypothetical protein [Bradyrhizobium sp. CCGUVB4N]
MVLSLCLAVGHPIGPSGSRILTTLFACLQERSWSRAIASICLTEERLSRWPSRSGYGSFIDCSGRAENHRNRTQRG